MAEVRLIEQAIGWAPIVPDLPTTMYDFLVTLQQKSPHGGPFEYRSCETDVLGWVCEAASGLQMPELMSQVLWAKLGARTDATIGVDSVGTGMFDGGINACPIWPGSARCFLNGTSLTGERVVSLSWIADTFAGGLDSRSAFAASPGDNRMPGRNVPEPVLVPLPVTTRVLLCLGIHGQLIYINRAANMVAAKLSSWPLPQDRSWLKDDRRLRRNRCVVVSKRNVEQRRRDLCDAAIELLAEGARGVTHLRVDRRAGFPDGTSVSSMPLRSALLRGAIDRVIELDVADFTAALNASGDGEVDSCLRLAEQAMRTAVEPSDRGPVPDSKAMMVFTRSRARHDVRRPHGPIRRDQRGCRGAGSTDWPACRSGADQGAGVRGRHVPRRVSLPAGVRSRRDGQRRAAGARYLHSVIAGVAADHAHLKKSR